MGVNPFDDSRFVEVGPVRLKGMDPTSLITAMVGAQMGRLQMAVAAKLLRMDTGDAGSAVQLIDAAQQSMQSLANAAAGLGQNVDIRV